MAERRGNRKVRIPTVVKGLPRPETYEVVGVDRGIGTGEETFIGEVI